MAGRSKIALGRVQRGGQEAEFAVEVDRLLRHALVVGGTGLGKSMLLASLLAQVIARHPNVSVVLIDQKGELAALTRDVILPALAASPHVRPHRVVVVSPFAGHVVGLDPLVPAAGVEPALQAWNVMGMLSGLMDEFGERMRAIGTSVLAATIEVGGSLLDAVRCLTDPDYARALGGRVTDRELSTYLKDVLHSTGESRSSIHALRARLEYLLRMRNLRGVLTCGSCLTGRDLLTGPITIVTTGGAPLGDLRLSRFFGQLVFDRITSGIFERSERDARSPVLLVADEFQELVRVNPEPVERILAQARSRGVHLWMACQSISQIGEVNPALVRSIQTNVDWDCRFRPDASEIRHLEGLLPVTGTRVDPERPDRLLSIEDERRALILTLTKLPPRFALVSDRRAGSSQILRTLTVPLDDLKARAGECPSETLRAFQRGCYGIPASELRPRPYLFSERDLHPEREVPGDSAGSDSSPAEPAPRRREARAPAGGRRRRPELVLP